MNRPGSATGRLMLMCLLSATAAGVLVIVGFLLGGRGSKPSVSQPHPADATATPAGSRSSATSTSLGRPTAPQAAPKTMALNPLPVATHTPASPTPDPSGAMLAAPSLPAISTVSGASASVAGLDTQPLPRYVPGYMHLYGIEVTNADGTPVSACTIALQIMHVLNKSSTPASRQQVQAALGPGRALNYAFNQFTGNDPTGVELLSQCALAHTP
jgi:hypothetical protein